MAPAQYFLSPGKVNFRETLSKIICDLSPTDEINNIRLGEKLTNILWDNIQTFLIFDPLFLIVIYHVYVYISINYPLLLISVLNSFDKLSITINFRVKL